MQGKGNPFKEEGVVKLQLTYKDIALSDENWGSSMRG